MVVEQPYLLTADTNHDARNKPPSMRPLLDATIGRQSVIRLDGACFVQYVHVPEIDR
jgi:hypothetical protein